MAHIKDPISLQRIMGAHPAERESIQRIYDASFDALKGRAVLRFAYIIRTFAEQHALYAQGRTTPGKLITWADAGLSYHNYGLAFDIVLLKDTDGNGTYDTASWESDVDFDGDGVSDWMEVVAIAKTEGWEWGGDWPADKRDKPHFQKTHGYTAHELLDKFNKGEFIPNTNFLRL